MKNFESWGIKVRALPEYNYRAMWYNLKTIRFGEENEEIKELPPHISEFYDVSLGTMCNLECPFCYVSASHNGRNFENVCELWREWMSMYQEKKVKNVTFTNKPFQIAIGSTGEPLCNPYFAKFLQTVYETNVVPNYTTNGVILSNLDDPWCQEILEATSNFVGGVAVSFGNASVRVRAMRAIQHILKYGNCKVMIHHIISDKTSVDEFVAYARNFGTDIHYHVLLPLMPHGRSTSGLKPGVYKYLEESIIKNDIKNVAFGANFYPYLSDSKLPVNTYPQEAYSKNIILDNKIIITPSSFDLTPIKEINIL